MLSPVNLPKPNLSLWSSFPLLALGGARKEIAFETISTSLQSNSTRQSVFTSFLLLLVKTLVFFNFYFFFYNFSRRILTKRNCLHTILTIDVTNETYSFVVHLFILIFLLILLDFFST